MTCFSCTGDQGQKDEPYAPQTNNNRATLEITPPEQNNGKESPPLTHTEVQTKKSGTTVTVVQTTRTKTNNTRTGGQNSASPFKSSIHIPIRGNDPQFKRISLNNDPEETEPLTHAEIKKSENENTITFAKTTRSHVVNSPKDSTIDKSTSKKEDSSADPKPVHKTTTVVKAKEGKLFDLKSAFLRRPKREEKTEPLTSEETDPLTHANVKKSENTITIVNTTRSSNSQKAATIVESTCQNEDSSVDQQSVYKTTSAVKIPKEGKRFNLKSAFLRRPKKELNTEPLTIEETDPSTHNKVNKSENGNNITIVKTPRSSIVNSQNAETIVGSTNQNKDSSVDQEPVDKTTKKSKRLNLKHVLQRRPKKEVKAHKMDMETLQEQCLLAHNRFRTLHGVEPLTLNQDMCRYAMKWAQHLAKKNKLIHRKKNKYGENVALGTGSTYKVDDAVQMWYDEMENYDFKRPGLSSQTGHFSQVVWKGSSQLGVGVAQKNDSTWVVCNYDPPGNVIGIYDENVQRPLRRTPKSKPLSDLVKVPPKNEKAKDDDAKPSTSLGFMKTANKKGKWSAFELECLDAHNKRRALHGCSPMTLNRDLCSLANDWASHLAKIRTMHHRPKNEYGENLYQLTNRDPTGEDCVKAWYDEISLYRYKKPGFSMDTGHFTQVVWLDTTELGVGRAKVDNITFIVCNYNPPGNVMGQYKTQVPPLGGFKENPIKANKDCSKDNNNQIKPNANEHSNSKKSNFFSFLKTNKAK